MLPLAGVGNVDLTEIYGIASRPEFVYNLTDFTTLPGITDAIINMTCQTCKLSITLPVSCNG